MVRSRPLSESSENANLDLERAKSELDKATKLKANAEQLKIN